MKGIGADHVQFLSPPEDSIARRLGAMAAAQGLTASTLWVTFHPVCPCEDAETAFNQAKMAIDRGRIIAGDENPNLVFSPSVFRGLCDPNHGLPGADDGARQAEFVARVAEYARTIPGTKIGAEPINRFETRGPNTLYGAANVIEAAKAGNVFGLLPDSCHQGLASRPIFRSWSQYAEMILAIHASSFSRGLLAPDGDIMGHSFTMAARDRYMANVLLITECFCTETDPGFFGPLYVHEPVNMSAIDLFRQNLEYLRRLTTNL